ncbi:MAG: cation diffusion facilitator family transporter [Candidatus Neomarinimicrobiota bacterium]
MASRALVGRLEAWVSIVVNALLAGVKLALGLAINSLSLVADAIHTISDMASSVVVLLGMQMAGKPADKEHPYGHGRAEYVATLIIAIMLGVIGFEFIKSSIARLVEPVPFAAGGWIMIAIALTIVIKAWLGSFSMTLGRMIQSTALEADAWHHRSDAISSVLVLIAVWGSSLGYPALDGIGGMLVGGYLIWSGFSIASGVINPLIGEPPSRELVAKIRKLCRDRENIYDAHDITVHKYGHHQFIGLHAEVSSALSVQAAHDIAEELAEYLQEELGAYTTVHVDPIDMDNPLVHQIGDRLNELIAVSEYLIGFQDLRVVETPQHKVILFEMEVAPEADLSQQNAVIQWLTDSLRDYFPDSEIGIQVSPLHTYR